MNWNNFLIRNEGKNCDDSKRRNAGQRALLYYLVALYIGYMGYSIMNNRLSGDDTLSYPLAIFFTSVLIIGAVFIAWFATKRMKNESKQSENETAEKEEN